MMRPTRVRLAVPLLAIVAAAASAATWSWQRQVEFAKGLCTRQYYDLADLMVARLEADPSIIGIEKAYLYRELGDYYADLAETIVAEKRDLKGFIDYLNESRAYFLKYLDHTSIKKNPKYAGDRFDIRMRLSRLSLATADGYARFIDDKAAAKPDKEKYKKQAVAIFKSAIAEFQRAVAEKAKEVARLKGITPPSDSDLRKKWRQKYRAAREELFRVRLERSIACVRFAKFLKQVKAPAKEITGQLDAAEKDYRQLLLDYSGTPGATQANFELACCLLEKGVTHDKEVLERLGEVWEKRDGYRRYKRMPCEAAELMAMVLMRQKKAKEAIPVLDGILGFASDGAWNPERKSVGAVVETLEAAPESDRVQFDQRACSRVFMTQAEAYAAQGAAAEKAKMPRKQIRELYGGAYDIALGVLQVRRFVDPKFAPLIETWRVKASRKKEPAVLWQEYLGAINKKKYADAAHLMSEIASQQALLSREALAPDKKREMWFTVGQCYYAGGHNYEAAIAFMAAGRWFPEPANKAHDAANAAVAAANAQFKQTKSPHDERFLRSMQEMAEDLNPYGKGGIYILQGTNARKEGKFTRAIELFNKVRPDQPAYPHALYNIGITYKAMFGKLSDDDKKGSSGKRTVAQMKSFFDKLFEYHKTRVPQLKSQGDDTAVERVVGVVAAAMAMYTDFHLRAPYKDPDKVLELTAGLEQRFPGIAKTAGFPVIIFSRMRAAYSLIAPSDVQRCRTLLGTIEEAWKTLGGYADFRYLDKAAGMGAMANISVAKKYEEVAKAAKDEAEKRTLLSRAEKLRDRALDFYLQLVAAAPNQTLRTYRYILHSLRAREHTPKSEDWHKIVELAPKVIEAFEGDRRAAKDLLFIKATLGTAYHGLEKWREAAPLLEEVDDALEKPYQDQLTRYKEAKRKWEEDPKRNPRPGHPPRRDATHPEIKETLAFCYLRGAVRTKYRRAMLTYVALTRLYARKPAKYWIVFYNLCETYRRLGEYEEAVKQIDRAYLRSAGTMHSESSKTRFRDLMSRLKKSVGRLEDAKRRDALEPYIAQLLDKLRK